jgi:hypothetical protein
MGSGLASHWLALLLQRVCVRCRNAWRCCAGRALHMVDSACDMAWFVHVMTGLSWMAQ